MAISGTTKKQNIKTNLHDKFWTEGRKSKREICTLIFYAFDQA